LLWGRVDIFMSEHDIDSGTRWADALAQEVKQSAFTIVCLTPENLQSAWLLYEAGALTSQDKQRLCTLLLGGLQERDVPSPLTLYQNQTFSEVNFQKLMWDILKTVENPPTAKEFTENFSRLWPEIWERYQEILKQFPPHRRPHSVVTTFEQAVLRLPLTEALLAELGNLVENIRLKCLEQIRLLSKQPHIAADCVRACVFVPRYANPPPGWACELFMHERLRRQMNRPDEWNIRFAPGQGATGTVFVECQQRIVKRRNFQLTDELRDAIDPELKWIISSPIKGSGGTALAVLNIDGLKYDCDNETVLQPVADLVSQELKRLQAMLDNYPKTTVTVQHSELQ
jgi:hypothetical protein